jgi:outer membrane protein OmpA-like peptidoglycan-associated protein
VRNVGAVAIDMGTATIASPANIVSQTCPISGQQMQPYNGSSVTDCVYNLRWVPAGDLTSQLNVPYGLTNSLALTGRVLQAQRTPEFDVPVPTADGFSVNVTNYSASWTWVPSVSAGSVTAGTPSGTSLPLTVSGLAPVGSATVTVLSQRSGYVEGSATVSGTARPAPSGGGGGSSSSGSPSPSPAPPRLDAEPVTGGLAPGSDRVAVGGTIVPAVVVPNASNTGIDIAAAGWQLSLAARSSTGAPVPLGPNGVLRFVRGQGLFSEGSGFKPNSPVLLYLFSDAVLLGELTTDASGSFSGTVPLPADVELGAHVAQVNGYTTGGEVRSVSLGVEVVAAATTSTSVGSRVYFPYESAKLTAKAKRTLRSLVSQVPAQASASSVVVGVVRAKGQKASDRVLARARAANVSRYLKAAGLPGTVTVTTRSVTVRNVAEARRVLVTVRYTG